MSQFGGIPVDSGSQFGGVPVDNADPNANIKITDPAVAAHLNNLYWDAANKAGAQSPEALSIFHVMKQHGIALASPSDHGVQQGIDAQAAQNTVKDQGFFTSANAGIGKSFVDTGQGLRQIGAMVADKVAPLPQTTAGLVSGQQPSRLAQAQQDYAQNDAANNALNHSAGGVAGQGIGTIAQLAIPVGEAADAAGLAGRIAPAGVRMLKAATYGASQPVAQGDSRIAQTVENGLLSVGGEAAAKALPVLASPLKSLANATIDPAKADLARLAQQYGIPLRLAQLSGNPIVQAASSMANKLPFSGGQAANAAQKAAVNQAASRTFGENTPAITSEVYDAAKSRLSNAYDTLFGRNTVAVTPTLGRDMADISQRAARDLGNGSNEAQIVNNQIQRIVDAADQGKVPGAIDGRLYQTIRQDLKGMESNDTKGQIIKSLRKSLEDAANKSFSGADAKALAETNQQYGNLKAVRDLVAKGSGDGISTQGLMGRVTANGYGKEAMARGKGGSLGDLARISSGLLKDQVPDSGTASRWLAANLFNPVAVPANAVALPLGAISGRLANSPALAQLALRNAGPVADNALVQRLALLARRAPFLAKPALVAPSQQNTP